MYVCSLTSWWICGNIIIAYVFTSWPLSDKRLLPLQKGKPYPGLRIERDGEQPIRKAAFQPSRACLKNMYMAQNGLVCD